MKVAVIGSRSFNNFILKVLPLEFIKYICVKNKNHDSKNRGS